MDTRRRALLLSALASPALGAARASQANASTMPLDYFLALSAQLCQRPVKTLDRDMAQRILQGLEEQGKMAALRRVQAAPTAASNLATELRMAWFSGLMPTASGTELVGFQHALAWTSTDFLHVPGICGGPTGYWSQPPAP